jgi:hypothetical protein
MLLEWTDFLILPLYLFPIFFLARMVQNRNINENPAYEYYTRGLFMKMAGGIVLVIIYTKYYEGGDTTAYFEGSVILDNLRKDNFDGYLEIMANKLTPENYSYFNADIGFPQYYRDKQSFAVVRFASVLNLISLNKYLFSTILLAAISFQGTWRLFLVFCEIYPKMAKQFAFSILFIPSVLFWGSGILKDTFTLMGASWFTYSFYKVFIKREKIIINAVLMVASAWLIIQMKPYIFIALVPGSLLWFSFDKIKAIKSSLVKFFIAPLLIVIVLGIGSLALGSLAESFGQYSSIDKIVDKAIVNQQDLKSSYTQGNNFDIGDFDGSFGSIVTKVPLATFAGLFFPQLWQARNPVMVIAGIENTIILIITLILIVRVGPRQLIKKITSQPLITFAIVFSVFFAFSVGLSTSNFGALVRYKIPAVPFFLSSILIIYKQYKDEQEEASLKAEEVKNEKLNKQNTKSQSKIAHW